MKKEQQLDLYHQMVLIRRVEERGAELYQAVRELLLAAKRAQSSSARGVGVDSQELVRLASETANTHWSCVGATEPAHLSRLEAEYQVCSLARTSRP